VRGCSEFVLIGRRGNVSPPAGDVVGLLSENFGHSRKPDSLHEYAELLPGPYLEMFARRPRAGWDVWGNQVAGSITLPVPDAA
jgi:N6-adenosine-specific RNA methylase IME4